MLYGFLSAVPLGITAALLLLIMSGKALWQSGKVNANSRMRLTFSAALLAAMGLVLMSVSVHLGLTQIAFGEARATDSSELPKTAPVAIVGALVVGLLLLAITAVAIYRRQAFSIAVMAALTFATGAVLCDTIQFRVFENAWSLGLAVCWIATGLSYTACLVITLVAQVRAYGRRQFERGQAVGIDAATQAAGNAPQRVTAPLGTPGNPDNI